MDRPTLIVVMVASGVCGLALGCAFWIREYRVRHWRALSLGAVAVAILFIVAGMLIGFMGAEAISFSTRTWWLLGFWTLAIMWAFMVIEIIRKRRRQPERSLD